MHTPTVSDLARYFATPPRDYSPAPIWWWSGDKLDLGRLKWQLEQFVAGGVYNVVILNLAPTGPLYGAEADDPEFFSEAWWGIFRGVCAHARALGVRIWFYDQIGFSGANLQAQLVRDEPIYAGQWLGSVSVEGDGALTVICPGEGQPLAASLTPVDAEGKATGAPVRTALDGRHAAANAARRSRLRLIYAVKRGFDYTSAAACAKLLDTVHNEFERKAGDFFGDVIVGSFQDELPTMPTWGPTFTQAFKQHTGYDILDRIELLWDGEDAQSQRVHVDAETVRATLAEEAFFKPLFNWHEARRLLCGFDQQHPVRTGHPIASVGLYADYLRTHRWFAAPGSDHHGDAKVHSSLAHLYDRPRVWIEAFHSSGWGGTLEETFDWLLPWLRAGANLYDPHAAYYGTRGGWWEWAPPSTCWRQPYWRHYAHFANAVSRLCYVLSQGQHVCDIGLLFPTTTVQAHLTPNGPLPQAQAAHDVYTALVGTMTWYDVKPGLFDQDHRDFDVLDDDSVQRATVEDGALLIGSERYRAVVLPACKVLQPATATMLARFAEAGGRLVAVGAAPQLASSDDQTAVQALQSLFANGHATLIDSAERIGAALADLPRRIGAPVSVLHRNIGGCDVVFVPAISHRATEMNARNWLDLDYTFDANRYQRDMTVRAWGAHSAPQLWEPMTGKRRAVPVTKGDGYVDVTIPFDSGPAALLVWDDATDEAAATTASQCVSTPLDGPWSAQIEPTLDNRFGDLDLPAYAGSPPVQTWFLQHRADESDGWQSATATFGTHGWWIGPQPVAELPAPLPLSQLHDGGDPLGVTSWKPAVYSLSRGIEHDPLHISFLGPKGRVPQEFLSFGPVSAGQAVRFRTSVQMAEPCDVHLVIGAPAAKSAWVNGARVGSGSDAPGYFWRAPVSLRTGLNTIEFELAAEQPVTMRALWALTTDAEVFNRPEWLTLNDQPMKDSRVRFTRTVHIPFEPIEACLHVGTGGACRVVLNGVEAGRQGGFDPYDGSPRVQRYITTLFHQGDNEVSIEVQDQGRALALFLDAEVTGSSDQCIPFVSGAGWFAQRDDQPPQPAALRRRQWVDHAYNVGAAFATGIDPAWPYLRRRPHPLPGAHWLEDAPPDGSVLPIVPDAFAGATRVEWFLWTLPAGATAAHLPMHGRAQLWVEGVEAPIQDGMAALQASDAVRRVATLRVIPNRGYSGGSIFSRPITYEMGRGAIALGPWSAAGLESYSGGLRYCTTFTLDAKLTTLTLDLGKVRGTAEAWVNGQNVGARVCSPFRFDVSSVARSGHNTLEVLVCNTLAPYLKATSPTHYIFAGQDVSGLFGPVELRSS